MATRVPMHPVVWLGGALVASEVGVLVAMATSGCSPAEVLGAGIAWLLSIVGLAYSLAER